jgi:hypothetical protein
MNGRVSCAWSEARGRWAAFSGSVRNSGVALRSEGLALGIVFSAMTSSGSTEASAFQPATTRAMAANRVSDRPEYSRLFHQAVQDYGWAGGEDLSWLDAGVDARIRYELRENDYRTPTLVSDDALFTRTLVYVGVREIIDPVRFAVEFQDSQRAITDRPVMSTDINVTDILQAHADLHFEDAIDGQPITVQFGRMTFDAVDRRLIARNRFRNVINSFDGVRLQLGAEKGPWEVDAFALRTVLRDADGLDRSSNNSLLFGVTTYWRRGSPGIQLEPFWLLTNRTPAPGVSLSQNQHTFGVHGFGQWDDSHWDYDLSVAGQLGLRGKDSVAAWALHGEVGYTWDTSWKPRLGLWVNAASGDQKPGDGTTQSFDPLYGATFSFYGYTGYFIWNNLINPSLRLSIQPTSRLRAELIYRTIWLESSRDVWLRGERGNPMGQNGDFVGQEIDMRISYGLFRWLDAEAVYALFLPGSFVANTGPAPLSSFTYLQLTLKF